MTTPLGYATGRLTVSVTEEDHIRGDTEAPVTLVEYGDYQCPFCARAHPILLELLRLRPSTVRLVFRHFPLTNVHPYAETAAEMAEAAGARRRFWAFHDWLFSHQDEIEPASLATAVVTQGMDIEAVAKEVAEHVYLERIRRDFVSGVRSGVNGTPTFYVNGLRHEGGYSLAELLAEVDDAADRS